MQDKDESLTLVRRALAHLKTRTTDMAPEVMELPAQAYVDPQRYQAEIHRIFHEHPLALAMSAELPRPNTYVAMMVVGVPVLLVRAEDGAARAFLNICRHRGAALCPNGAGSLKRLVCPYHAWQYDLKGGLKAVYGASTFGEVDAAASSLTQLPCEERAGLVWVCLTPGTPLDLDAWLGSFSSKLESAGLDTFQVYRQLEFQVPGWKATWEGYQEAYHHSVLHAQTLGKVTVGNLCLHDTYGPHQRIVFGRRTLEQLHDLPESQWEPDQHIRKVHLAFPNMAVSGVLAGYCLVSQVFPGPTHDTAVTRQTILVARQPETEEERTAADEFADLVLRAIRDEDTPVIRDIQAGLNCGYSQGVKLGRNEPALQHFHRMVAKCMAEPSSPHEGGRL